MSSTARQSSSVALMQRVSEITGAMPLMWPQLFPAACLVTSLSNVVLAKSVKVICATLWIRRGKAVRFTCFSLSPGWACSAILSGDFCVCYSSTPPWSRTVTRCALDSDFTIVPQNKPSKSLIFNIYVDWLPPKRGRKQHSWNLLEYDMDVIILHSLATL